MPAVWYSRSRARFVAPDGASLSRGFGLGVSLNGAYRAARRYPFDAARRLRLAKVLLGTRRLDLARRHALRAAALAPTGWSRALDLGRLLFQLGEFEQARHWMSLGLETGIPNATAMRTFSALLTQAGKAEESRTLLTATARECAFELPRRIDPSKPNVLQIRTPENSTMKVGRDKMTGLNMTAYCEGHFSTRHLLATSQFNVIHANIAGNHLPALAGLPEIAVVINTVSCPDLNADILEKISDFCRQLGDVPMVNHPGAVLRTTREMNAQRLGALDGVQMARTLIFVNDGAPKDVAQSLEVHGIGYPMILRKAGTQTGHTLAKIDGRASLLSYLSGMPHGTRLYAGAFIDCRDACGTYRKTRAFFIDGQFYPVANLKSDHWQIHSSDRYRLMHTSEAMQIDEERYLANPVEYLGKSRLERLYAVRNLIGLDFFGIDFTTAPNEELLIFEANAAMRHNYDHVDTFPYTKPYLDRISNAFTRMIHQRAEQRGFFVSS
ncbi:MAG: hypothetical protein AAGA71_21115 [Pseudomonadota bacterium]